ncbi:Transposase IS4 [Popillia japonica]|uniref:Transposase IS4 n=1 Tax=Popillia japonica TaxID=7064 RepID=A0AAW1I8Q8_POPJA
MEIKSLKKRYELGRRSYCVRSGESDIESDADYVSSDHDSDSEIEADQDFEDNITENKELKFVEPIPSPSTNYFYGKDRYKWSKLPPYSKNTRTLRHTIVIKCPELKNRTVYREEPQNVWHTLFDDEIIGIILQWTNKRLARLRLKYKNKTTSDLRDLDVLELRSFIGLLLFTSIFKSNHEDIRSIFATDGSGRDIFRHKSYVTNARKGKVELDTGKKLQRKQ